MVLNDTEWYSMVISGIPLVLFCLVISGIILVLVCKHHRHRAILCHEHRETRGSAGEVCPRQRVSVGITELFAVGSRHSVRREEL